MVLNGGNHQLSKVNNSKYVWQLDLKNEHIQSGIDYGIISHAWTYDRMNSQHSGNFGKTIFRISVGVTVQKAIESELFKRFGTKFERDSHDYKQEDYWDMLTNRGRIIDVKSYHCFTDSSSKERKPLSCESIVESTTGESWSTFFPMLIPRDQFTDSKHYYIFAILYAPSPKRFPFTCSNAKFLVAIPSSKEKEINRMLQGARARKATKSRIESGRTFSIQINRLRYPTLIDDQADLTIGYSNRKGSSKSKKIRLRIGDKVEINGLTSFHFLRLHDPTVFRKNTKLFEITFKNFDEETDVLWEVFSESFTDIWIYSGKVYCIGWISKSDFEESKNLYSSFAANSNWSGNGPHNDKTARGLLSRKSFCYYYPPVYAGGTQAHNYYCLPKDLNIMDDIVEILR